MEAVAEISTYEQQRNKPIPSKNHSIVQGNLYFLIRQLFGKQYKILPELSLKISPKDKVPDLAIYKKLEFTPGLDEVKVKEMPLGVIEILAPSQSMSELISKSRKYFDAGIKSYWLVLPDVLTVYVYKAPGDFEVFSKKEILKDRQLGIELDLGEVFK
ncbi:MAG TPA: Uma2 family endonuclease [Bacteroidetes bacterium]|nr:Uma2 family endonuclease [Bacteroidota bacterium]